MTVNYLNLPTALLAALALLAGCSAPRQPDPRPALPVESAAGGSGGFADPRARAAEVAVLLIGAPYRFGSSGPGSFDCSGLVQYSYRTAGLIVPRTSGEQYQLARPISLAEARPGDLLFFRDAGSISHVAIYLGDLRFVHAPSSGKQVEVASLQDPYYQRRFAQAGRVQ